MSARSRHGGGRRPPPMLAAVILRAIVPARIRPDVLEDLADKHAELALTDARMARSWYRRQAWASVGPAILSRLSAEYAPAPPHRQFSPRGDRFMATTLYDIRHALRWARHNPGFTATILTTLALGIGANTAIFSVVHGVLLEAMPYPNAERIVRLYNSDAETRQVWNPLSEPELALYRERDTALEVLAGLDTPDVTLTGGAEPERVRASVVTDGFFDVFGSNPLLGRTLRDGDGVAGRDGVVVISHGLWRRALGGDAGAVGKRLRVDGRAREIVGVMPPDFDFYPGTDVWLPLVLDLATLAPDRVLSHGLAAVALLQEGRTLASSQDELDGMIAGVLAEYPQHGDGHVGLLMPLHEWTTGSIRPTLLALSGAVGFLILIVCANVANLLLARAAARHGEIAVRAALGAGRWRLARQLLTESSVLAVCGGLLGVGVAWSVLRAAATALPAILPRSGNIELSVPVLLFSLGLSLVTGLAFGLVPVVQLRSAGAAEVLRGETTSSGGAGRRRARSVLVVAEVALVVTLLLGATLMGRSLWNLLQVDPGVDAANALTFELALSEGDYPTHAEVVAAHETVLRLLERLPEVRAVGAVSWLPFVRAPSNWGIEIEGKVLGEQLPIPDYANVAGDYFEAIGIDLVRGRLLQPSDRATGVLITAAAAATYWPDEDPLGQRLRLNLNEWRTIVGIVADHRNRGLKTAPRPGIYLPHVPLQFGSTWLQRSMGYVVRTTGDPLRSAAAVRQQIWSFDSELPLQRLRPLDEIVAGIVSRSSFTTALLMAFAGVALTLGAIGIYGVVSYAVAERRQEIGIRMALGASSRGVIRMVVTQGMGRVAVGLLLGLLSGYWATATMMATLLFEVEPTDPVLIVAVAGLLAAVGLVATLLPAVRATHVDPVSTLRQG